MKAFSGTGPTWILGPEVFTLAGSHRPYVPTCGGEVFRLGYSHPCAELIQDLILESDVSVSSFVAWL